MAKKVVATLKDKTRVNLTKVFVPTKNEKTNGYSFKEELMPSDKVEAYLKEHGNR